MIIRYVKDLRVGDLLSSGVIIIGGPQRGIKTPSGKHEIWVAYPDGMRVRRTWNSYTKIGVTPAPDCFVLDEKSP